MWTGEIFRIVPSSFQTSSELPAGSYIAGRNEKGELLIKPQSIVSDRLVQIPSPEYSLVTNEIQKFLLPETQAKYIELGFIYKRSFFLYGKPGTGKSCLVNRVAQEVIAGGGIVLVNTNSPMVVQQFLQEVRNISPKRMIMVVLEEFDAAIKNFTESDYLTMLDGQVQVDNVVYMATTNYIENIPVRLLRPGRFSRCLEIGYPNQVGRQAYIEAVFPTVEPKMVRILTKATEGCSIDEVREVLQAHLILGDDIRTTVQNLKKIRGISKEESDGEYEDPEAGDDYETTKQLGKAVGSNPLGGTFEQTQKGPANPGTIMQYVTPGMWGNK